MRSRTSQRTATCAMRSWVLIIPAPECSRDGARMPSRYDRMRCDVEPVDPVAVRHPLLALSCTTAAPTRACSCRDSARHRCYTLTHTRVSGSPYQREPRSEEHTSELQSLRHLICRL